MNLFNLPYSFFMLRLLFKQVNSQIFITYPMYMGRTTGREEVSLRVHGPAIDNYKYLLAGDACELHGNT